LAYAAALLDAGEAELDQERERLERARKIAPDGDSAVRLALLFGLPDSRLRDVPRANALLRNWAAGPGADPSWVQMARLLSAVLERGDDQTRALGQTRQRLASERARRVRLQEQLEALKSIEERINRAEPPATLVPVQPVPEDEP
jgi:hypothetical protein